MSKKTKTDHIHLRPFDQEHFDFDYFHDLSEEDQKYLLSYLGEEINGWYVKKNIKIKNKKSGRTMVLNTIYTKEVLKQAYLKIKENPEALRQFNARLYNENDSRKKKKQPKLQPIDFIKLEWQRENSRRVWERRNDAYATLINTNKIDENKGYQKKGIKIKAQVQEVDADGENVPEKNKDILASIKADHNKEESEVQFFIRCKKLDRVDYFIWSQLMEVVQAEKETPEMLMVKEDLKEKNNQFERKDFTRSKYMIYLLNCVELLTPLITQPDGVKIIEELKNIFNLVIYPYKQGKLQKEKI